MLTSLGMWLVVNNLVPIDQLGDDIALIKCALQIELTMPHLRANIFWCCVFLLSHGGGRRDVCKAPGIGVPPKGHKCCQSEQRYGRYASGERKSGLSQKGYGNLISR